LLALCLLFAGCAAPTLDSGPVGPESINDSLRERHADALPENFSYDANLTTAEGTQRLDTAVAANRSLTHVAAPELTTAEFANASGTYVRSVEGGETTYQYRPSTPDRRAFTVAAVPFNATYERVGTGRIGGTPVARYESTNASDDLALAGFAAFGVRNFSATLAVTDDGLVKRAAWSAETPAGPYRYNATYSALGTTEVETPAWVGEVEVGPPSPQANFEFTYDNGTLRVQHRGGDSLDGEAVSVRVRADGDSASLRWSPEDGDVAAGDDIALTGVPDGATVEVVWESESASRVLASETV
jgi:hypothetical protein